MECNTNQSERATCEHGPIVYFWKTVESASQQLTLPENLLITWAKRGIILCRPMFPTDPNDSESILVEMRSVYDALAHLLCSGKPKYLEKNEQLYNAAMNAVFESLGLD